MYHPGTLAAAQRELEIVNLQEGVDRYYARQERKANTEGFERRTEVAKVIRGAVPLVASGIKAWIAEASEKKRGRPHAALAALKEIDSDVVALAALSKTFHTVAKGLALSATAKAIGTVVQVELEAQMIQAKDANPRGPRAPQRPTRPHPPPHRLGRHAPAADPLEPRSPARLTSGCAMVSLDCLRALAFKFACTRPRPAVDLIISGRPRSETFLYATRK